MAVLSVILADICVFNAEFTIDRNRKPVQNPDHLCSIFLIHGTRLMPYHPLAQLLDELLHRCAGKLGGHDKIVQVIGGTIEGLFRGKGKMFGEQHKIDYKTMSEFAGHILR